MQRSDGDSATTLVWSVLIFVAALGVRLFYLYQLGETPFFNDFDLVGDARYYDMRAREITAGDWFGDTAGFLSPFYCLTMAAVYFVAGPGLPAVKMFHAVLGALSCVLLYLIARRLFSESVGRIAGGLLAFYALHVYYTGIALPATVIVFLHLMLVLVLTGGPARWRWLVGGLLIGLCAAAKANAVLLLPALILVVWLVRRGVVVRERILASALLTIGTALAIAPVTIGNYVASDSFVLLTTTGGNNFLKGNGPDSTGTHVFLPHRAPVGLRAHFEKTVDPREAVRQSKLLRDEAWQHMLSRPGRTVGMFAKKLLLFLNGKELAIRDQYYFARTQVPLLRWPLISFWVVVPLGLAGIWFSRSRREELAVLWAVLAVQAVSFILIFVLARYRMVAVACVLPFAAKQIVDVCGAIRAGEWRKLGTTALFLAVFSGVAFVPFSEFPRDRGFADQYKFVADQHLRRGSFDLAAGEYRKAIDSDWQDPRRTELLRWECMLRLAQSEIPLGRAEAARQTLESLLAELQAAPSAVASAFEHPARQLLEQLDFWKSSGDAVPEPAAGAGRDR